MSVFFILMVAVLAVANGKVRVGDHKVRSDAEKARTAPCTVDLIFLDDGSSSICEGKVSEGTCPNWEANLRFIEDIIRYLNVDVTKSRVAYLKYGQVTNLVWGLDSYTSQQQLLDAVATQTIPGGELTNTSSFGVVVDAFKQAAAIEGVKRVAVLITDDANITDAEAIGASNALQNATGLKMMMVCLNTTTSKCHVACAAPLSSYPHLEGVTYFMSETYLAINDVRDDLQDHICVFQDPPKATPATSRRRKAPQ